MPSTPEYRPDAETLARYHAGTLPEAEAAALERAAAEALTGTEPPYGSEGWWAIQATQRMKNIDVVLQRRIEQKEMDFPVAPNDESEDSLSDSDVSIKLPSEPPSHQEVSSRNALG